MELDAALQLLNLQRIEEEQGSTGEDASSDDPQSESSIENVRLTQEFIQRISEATLDNTKLSEDVRKRLREPLEGPVNIEDPDTRLSLDLFLACEHSSEETYTAVRDSIIRRFPGTQVLTYAQVKNLVRDITGVESINEDMCLNSC